MRAKIISVVVIILLVGVSFVPSVLAESTVELEQIMYIDPDGTKMTWTDTFNFSDPSSNDLTNYNSTIVPFMDETGINGTFTGTFLPPMTWKINDSVTFDEFRFSSLVRFKSSWVMSGSSVSWWRAPVLNITDWSELNISIWNIVNPSLLNFSSPGVPNAVSVPTLIYYETYHSERRNVTWFEQNVTAWDYDYTFYWFRVDAPIHANEDYLIEFKVDGSSCPDGVLVQFSQTDVSDDHIFRSWFDFGDPYEAGCDLDISVIHQYGMGHTVSGWEIDISTYIIIDDELENVDGTTFDIHNPDYYNYVPGDGNLEIDTDQAADGNSSLWFNYPSGTTPSCSYDTYIDNGIWTAEFDIRADNTAAWMELSFHNKDDNPNWLTPFRFAYPSGTCTLFYGNGVGGTNSVFTDPGSVIINTWYHVRIDCDIDNNKWRGWLDGVMYPGPNADSRGFDNYYQDGTFTEALDLNFWKRSTNGDAWVDNVIVYRYNDSSIAFFSRLSEPVNNATYDYVTFMMPFIGNITNATNVRINLYNPNRSFDEVWWVAEDGDTDFTLKSFLWGHDYPGDLFAVNVTVQNQSQTIFIYDQNSEYNVWFENGTQDYALDYTTNEIWVLTAPKLNASLEDLFRRVWHKPYHALQHTDGEWINTQLPMRYLFEGRIVNITDMELRQTSHSPPWYIKVAVGALLTPLVLYNIADYMMFDILPDVSLEDYLTWVSGGAEWLKDHILDPINVWVGYFIEVVKFIAKAGAYLLVMIMKAISIFIFFPFWMFAVLLINGVKRFGVIMASEGAGAAAEYAEEFITNSTSMVRKIPAMRITSKVGGRVKRSFKGRAS